MKFPLLVFVFYVLGSFLIISPTLGHGEESTEFVYTVTESSEKTFQWWNGEANLNYIVRVNETIEFTLEEISSASVLDIRIGNLSEHSVIDSLIDMNLILGHWKVNYNLGIISETNWDKFDTIAEMANFTNYTKQESIFTHGTTAYKSIEIEFAGTQNTNLVYSFKEGILLRMHSTFGNYELGFTIASISGTTLETTQGTTKNSTVQSTSFFSFIFLATVLGFLPFKKVAIRKFSHK